MSSIGSGGPTSWQASLLQASAKGDETKVRELVREGVLHGDKFKDALRIALQKVAGRGHEPLTRLFLEEGAEVNGATENEVTALYRAAELGHHKVVRLLLDKGADTESRDKFKRTVLFSAAAKGHAATVKLLLEAGADVNVRDVNEQNVMLFLASEKPEKPGRWGKEIVRLLLGTHIDLEVKDKDDRTPLLWAAATGKEMLVNLLLTGRDSFNANVGASNMRGKTALHLAAENNRIAIVKLLLDNKADPAARSDGGWTALHNAADRGHEEIVKLILGKTKNVNAETSSGMTALHWAAQNGHIGMVKLLLEQNGIRKNCKDSFDTTPMLRAAQNGHLDIVKLLSPTDDWKRLSENAKGACKGFQANVVDFGMENRSFNNNKYSVYDLLYGRDEKKEKPTVTTLARNIPAKPAFRWIHLPANNMSWVEALITNHFIEDSAKDVEGFKALEKSFGQQHKGPTVHSHFMRPLCQRMHPSAKISSPDEPESGTEKSAPEIEVAEPGTPQPERTPTKDSSKSDKKAVKAEKQGKKSERPGPKGEQSGNAARKASNSLLKDLSLGRRESRQSDRSRTPMGKMPRPFERNGNIVLFMPYLHYEIHRKRAEMSEAIKRAMSGPEVVCGPGKSINNDEKMVQAYLRSTHNLQIRRTLDQFYYHGIDTGDRDEDQVVYRYCRDRRKQRKVFMVDQLWLWIIGKDLIITSFPQRWGQPKDDPLNVLDGVIEDLNSKTRPPVKSVYDLAMLITGRCSGVFDRHRLGDEDFQFLDMFESSIGEVTNKETELFKKFNDASTAAAAWLMHQRQRGRSQIPDVGGNGDDRDSTDPTFVDTLLDIGEETKLLAEIKDVRDELNMIKMVLDHQDSILEDLTHALCEELKGNHNQQKQAEIKKRFREQSKVVEVHLKDVDRMDKHAEGIYTSLTHLLDLKQKHANAFEARFARDQAANTGRQGQTIMVFTIVTIVFLPMSFMASFFTISIKEFPRDPQTGNPSLSVGYVAKYMFGIGLAISIPLIAIAFAVNNIGQLIKNILKSIVGLKTSSQQRFIQSRQTTEELEVIVEMELKQSGETAMPLRRSFETNESHLGPVMRTFSGNDRSWKDRHSRERHSREWNGNMRGRFSRDLERGQGVG